LRKTTKDGTYQWPMFLVCGSRITVYGNGTPAAVADSGIVQKGGLEHAGSSSVSERHYFRVRLSYWFNRDNRVNRRRVD